MSEGGVPGYKAFRLFFALFIVAALIRFGFLIYEFQVIGAARPLYEMTLAGVAGAVRFEWATAAILLLAFTACGAAYLRVLTSVNRLLMNRGVCLRWSARMNALAHIVPGWCLFGPYRIMRDLMKKVARSDAIQPVATMDLWWMLMVLAIVGDAFLALVALDEIDAVQLYLYARMITTLGYIASAFVFRWLVASAVSAVLEVVEAAPAPAAGDGAPA